jgi:hypothetical protein
MEQNKSVGSVHEFISALELGESGVSARQVRLDVAQPSAAVDAGSLVSFVADVSEQHRADVLNATLLAQLAANKRFDRERDTENWYTFYRNALEQVGWVVRQQAGFSPFQTNNTSFTADEVIITFMKTVAGEDEVTGLQAALKALKSLDGRDRRVLLFECGSHSARNGNFQISTIGESNGIVVMKLGAFFFSTTDTVTRILLLSFPSRSTTFSQGSQVLELNEQVYAPLRQDVINKLGDRVEIFIGDLGI